MDDGERLEEVDPNFLKDLEESKETVAFAARWLASWGKPVVLRPTFARPDVKDRHAYSDNGDLEVLERVEIKHIHYAIFTCAEDYPFPQVLVDNVHNYERANPKPAYYLHFNKPRTAVMRIVCAPTFKHWEVREIFMPTRGRSRTVYMCPKELVEFRNVRFGPS